MSRKNIAASKPQEPPSLSPDQAAQLLRSLHAKGQQLLENRPISSDAEQAWETVAHDWLIRAFGSASPNVGRVMDVGRYAGFWGEGNEITWEQSRAENMTTRLGIIKALIDSLDEQIRILETLPVKEKGPSEAKPICSHNKVFLVHGHNEAIKHETARFLEKLNIQVTILHEQPNAGRTIIEKFIDHTDVGFAVILLTGDDRGGTFSESYENQKLRARQNAILELGFFLGKLGRKNVCALYQEGVEIPSDYNGVLFVPLDTNGAWHFTLARELKSAGLGIDMNMAI